MTTAVLRQAEPVAPIDIEEEVPLLFDFTDMAPDDSIAGTPVVTCEVTAGEDASASTRPQGAPQVSGLQAVQMMAGCVQGTTYLVRCKATMASGLVLVQAIELPCLKVGVAA